jgi:hypothetical protein
VETFHPRAAALLNLTPDHLDRYDSLDHYLATKVRIFARQEPADTMCSRGRPHDAPRPIWPPGCKLRRGRWRTGADRGLRPLLVRARRPPPDSSSRRAIPPGAAQPREFRRRALPSRRARSGPARPGGGGLRQPRAPHRLESVVRPGVTCNDSQGQPGFWRGPQGSPGYQPSRGRPRTAIANWRLVAERWPWWC